MSYDKKLLGVLDKILDAILYEEGRLALLNKFGPYLSDEEKAIATELITAQRASLDRLFEMFKGQLSEVVVEISNRGEEMDPLVSKLLSAEKIARTMVAEQTGEYPQPMSVSELHTPGPNDLVKEGEGSGVVTSEEVVADSSAAAGTEVAVEDATGIDPNAVNNSGSAVVSGVSAESGVVTGTEVVPIAGEGVALAPVETEEVKTDATAVVAAGGEGNEAVVTTDVVVPEGGAAVTEGTIGEGLGVAAGGEVGTDAASANDILGDANAVEDGASAFVLSPIDEGVTSTPTEEEKKAAEAVVEGANAQLNAVEAVKTEIEENADLTPEEKEHELAKYTKVTEGAVRAILVTKSQFEKLLASRDAQKTLVDGGNSNTAEVSGEEVVAALPDFTASEGGVVPAAEGNGTEVAPATDGVVIPAITPDATAVVPVSEAGTGEVVLPMITDGAPTATDTSGEVSLPVVEGGDVALPAVPAVDAANKQAELQTMIEQANALYKEGKMAEAQELFDKVGAINKEMQGGSLPADAPGGDAAVEDPAVLVKK